MEITRARGSEEMGEEEVEKTPETSDLGGSSFQDLVIDWEGPDDLADDLVDLVWDTVNNWLKDWESAAGNFFQYCISLCDNLEESYEVRLWMLNLIAHNVAEDESWLDSVHTAKDWREIFLSGDWEVPPPLWLVRREEEEEEKNKESKSEERAKESLECVTTSPPLDPGWGKGLPAPTPTVAAPSTPVWRPWEEEEDVVVNLSAAVQKRKRRSPAAAARNRRRLQQWQEKVDRNRLKSELRTTPLRSAVQMRGTRLLGRLEGQDGGGIIHAGSGGSWMEGKTVFVSNQTQTSMLPQSFQSPMSTFAPVASSPSIDCRGRLDVPNVVTLCPACRAWGLLTPT